MPSSKSAQKLLHDYPSGSNWKAKEVEAVRFAAEPLQHEFRDYTCGDELSDKNKDVLKSLSVHLAVPPEDIENEGVLVNMPQNRRFYEALAKLLRPASVPPTPNQPRTRNTIFNKSSSPPQYNDDSQETPKAQLADTESRKTPKIPPSLTNSLGSSPPISNSTRPFRNSFRTPSPTRRLPAIDSDSKKPCSIASRSSVDRSPSPQGNTAEMFNTDHPESDLNSSPLSPAPPESEQLQRFLEADFRSSQTDLSYEASSVITAASPQLPGKQPEKLVDELYSQFLSIIRDAHRKVNGYEFAVNYSEEMKIMIAGDEINTTPDLTVSVKIEGNPRSIPIFDLESKSPSQDEKYGQKVSEILARAKEMRDRSAQHPYPVYLLSAKGVSLRLTTCTLGPSYMKQLERDPFDSRYPPIEVKEYGPIDISDPECRVLAASTIYKLMIRCANRIVEDERLKAENNQKVQNARSGKSKK